MGIDDRVVIQDFFKLRKMMSWNLKNKYCRVFMHIDNSENFLQGVAIVFTIANLPLHSTQWQNIRLQPL